MVEQAARVVAVALVVVTSFVVPCSHARAILESVEVYQGQTAVLPCRTSLSVNVDWQYTSQRRPGHFYHVYAAAGLVREYSKTGRYSVVEAGGWYNLTIKRVNISDGGEYICKEDQGFGPPMSTHLSVRDIDECSSPPINGAVCSRHARCTNTIGSYFCTCLDGFEGDGRVCTDVNECKNNSRKNDCVDNAVCDNTSGGYKCSCRRGSVGVGNVSCVYVAEPVVIYSGDSVAIGYGDRVVLDGKPSIGDHSVKITNMQPRDVGYYVCADAMTMLNPVAFLVNISDVNICERKERNLCHQNATCSNTWGSYSCTCKPGFRGNGHHCEDVDECAEGKHDCVDGANCENRIGRYACHCKAGTIGIGNVSCIDLASIQPAECKPLDAMSGDTVRLTCDRTDSNALHSWWYLAAAGDGVGKTFTPVKIYNGITGACDTIVFNNRLSCQNTNNDDLVLNDVNANDAGIFVCAELTSLNVYIPQRILLNVTVSYTGKENGEASSASSSTSTSSYRGLLWLLLLPAIPLAAAIFVFIRRHRMSRSGDSEILTGGIGRNEEQLPSMVLVKREKQTVRAIATYEDNLFWASRKKIHVCDKGLSEVFTLLDKVDIYIKGMTVCKETGCLYVSDSLKQRIHMVHLSELPTPTRTSSFAVSGMPCGLSVSSDRRVIVVVDANGGNTSVLDESENESLIGFPERGNATNTCRIVEYSLSGDELSVIVLPAELTSVRHAVKIVDPSSDEDVFLVSHGDGMGELNRVCKIDRSGRFLKCFGGEAGPSSEQLNKPMQLVTDANGRVYVADSANNKVKVLNGDLTFESQYDINGRPTSLCLDDNVLYVGVEYP